MNGRFQILLRRRQNTYEGNNVIVQCNPVTGYAEYVPGTVDNTLPFADITPVGGFYDFTNFIEGAEKLSLTWDKVNSGNSTNTETNQDGSNYDKGITSDLMFFDSAYQFIYDWLLLTECGILNCVEVKIIDLVARAGDADPVGTYRIFEIKSDNLDWAPVDEPCQFHIKLREQDSTWHCIHKTFIWDNHQNWFNGNPVKTHPCFLTCIEPRPRLVNSARMAFTLFFHSHPLIKILGIFNVIGDMTENVRRIMNADRFVDAPLVRTYIENVADKCGMTFDTIFDTGQEWENLCLFYPQAGYMHEHDGDNAYLDIAFCTYHFDNRWLITIAELLDKLKPVFAAEWYVTPLNKIVFKYKKDLITLAPIYDFTADGAEPIYDLRYTFNGSKKPAYGRYQYQDDGSDLASQEMSTLYSDIIDYDGPANNPMLEGERLKNFEFAPTGFVRDGRAKDYMSLLINDGKFGALVLMALFFVVLAILGPSAPFTAGSLLIFTPLLIFWVGILVNNVSQLRNIFVEDPTYTGAVRLTSEQVLTPRLILWDGLSIQRAKAVADVGLPAPNPFYNPDLVAYNVKNDISQDNPTQTIYNYNLYFDGDFQGNLFPRFHDIIDNPLKSLETHQDVKWSVDLCEGMLNLFGVFQNQYAQIGKVVKLENRDNYDVYVRIGNISVDYDSHKINLKGTVLRRQFISGGYDITIPVAPVESGELIETYPQIVPPEENVCLKWKNDSVNSVVDLIYVDCNGALLQNQTLAPQETFCAYGIISLGTGGNIVATEICEGGSPGSPGSPGAECYNFQNLSLKDAIGVSYTDCDGNLVTGATIPAQSVFCAREITDEGTCGIFVNAGLCSECDDEADTNLRRWI